MLSILLDTRPNRPAPGTLDPLLFGLFLVIAVALFIVAIFLLQYVYKDADKRGLNAELWLIIILLAPIIGILVYFIVRREKPRL